MKYLQLYEAFKDTYLQYRQDQEQIRKAIETAHDHLSILNARQLTTKEKLDQYLGEVMEHIYTIFYVVSHKVEEGGEILRVLPIDTQLNQKMVERLWAYTDEEQMVVSIQYEHKEEAVEEANYDDLVAILDYLHEKYPDILEGAEMGFFNKETN